MARKSRRSSIQAGELNLTAMIDVAFQLLSFFVVTLKPVDVIANLDVSRPEPSQGAAQKKQESTILSIKIFPNGIYTLNDRVINKENLDLSLKQIGEMDKGTTVVIVCTPDSTHAKLCEVLDLCTKAELGNISLMSAY